MQRSALVESNLRSRLIQSCPHCIRGNTVAVGIGAGVALEAAFPNCSPLPPRPRVGRRAPAWAVTLRIAPPARQR